MTAEYAAERAIETSQLAKTYPLSNGEAVHALRGIDLSIEQGEIYALLGPNGAGKTTAFAILTTLLAPTSGSARVAGHDVVRHPARVRRAIGVTFQEVILDQELTGRQILDFHGQLYGQPRPERNARIGELAELVELTAVLDRKAAGYSGGMKRRLELARGLMTRPQILFLDEPTQGLDPQNRAGIWRHIQRLRGETGLTLLLTTHYMEEADALADRVGIIDRGQLIVEGAPAELKRAMGADVVTLCGYGDAPAYLRLLEAEPYVSQAVEHSLTQSAVGDNEGVECDQWRLQIGVDSGDRRLARLLALAAEPGLHVSEVSVSRPSLADVFLAHTGRALRDS
ncbi:MAG: ATP-binding cassette domain-containing protein [Chloroflexota bacterium]|nr:ATP-binding cassette domain-containing protein [Chloroflexota bacterium]